MSKREPSNDQIEVTSNPNRSCYEVRVNGARAGAFRDGQVLRRLTNFR